MSDFPVTAAESALASAEARAEELRRQIRAAEIDLHEAERTIDIRRIELQRARAAADSDAIPVGTRVRHHHWADVHGTVVESDGTGIAVLQDGQSKASTGFAAREWIAL